MNYYGSTFLYSLLVIPKKVLVHIHTEYLSLYIRYFGLVLALLAHFFGQYVSTRPLFSLLVRVGCVVRVRVDVRVIDSVRVRLGQDIFMVIVRPS